MIRHIAKSKIKDLTPLIFHPDSDEKAFELLERSKPWALQNNATLEIELLEEKHEN